MRDQVFRCQHCRKVRPRHSADQGYCSSEICQKARKNAWRQNKLRTDPDYRTNQTAATQTWLESQGGSAAYHRRYRARKRAAAAAAATAADGTAAPESTTQQVTGPVASAKSDAKVTQSAVKSGIYRLVPWDAAKSDTILVELAVIPGSWGQLANIDAIQPHSSCAVGSACRTHDDGSTAHP
jgi:hypothetical protein